MASISGLVTRSYKLGLNMYSTAHKIYFDHNQCSS